jgi:hypothetical protein
MLTVSTSLEIKPSVQKEVAVPTIWEYPGAFAFGNVTAITNLSTGLNQNSIINVYFV